MSGPLKKARAVFPVEDYSSEEEEELETEDELVGQTIDVDFDAFRAEDSDFHGIRRLLAQSFRGLEIDISGIADIIISQNYVGSVVRQVRNDDDDDDDDDDDEDKMDTEDEVFGVSTVINLTSRKDEEPIAKLRSALVDQCQNHGSDSTNTLVRESLGNESKHVGILISERLVNLPPQFAMPVYESLVKELESAKKKGLPYDFTYLVMLCKLYKQQEKRTKKKSKPSLIAEVLWSNPEEEIFEEESIASFEYPVKGDTGLTGKWEEEDAQYFPYRKVLILDGKQLPAILTKVRQSLSQ